MHIAVMKGKCLNEEVAKSYQEFTRPYIKETNFLTLSFLYNFSFFFFFWLKLYSDSYIYDNTFGLHSFRSTAQLKKKKKKKNGGDERAYKWGFENVRIFYH